MSTGYEVASVFKGLVAPPTAGQGDLWVNGQTNELLGHDGRRFASLPATAAPLTNLLVNPGLEIWQRGAGPFTATLAYAADRWQLSVTTSTVSVARESTNVDTGSQYSAAVTYTHAGGGVVVVRQVLEDLSQAKGRTLTFAVRVKSSVAGTVGLRISDGVNTYDGARNATTGWETLTVTGLVATNATALTLQVRFEVASCTAYLDNATLCVGSGAMTYTPLRPADDLLQCQRYYQSIGGLDTNEVVGSGPCFSTTSAQIPLRLPVEMAIAPTVTVSAAADFAVFGTDGTTVACTALTASFITRKDLRLVVTTASGLTAGAATYLRAAGTASALIALEANP